MKVEVGMPDGKYCGDCRLVLEIMCRCYHYICGWSGEELDPYIEDAYGEGVNVVKHPDCPSLKEKK